MDRCRLVVVVVRWGGKNLVYPIGLTFGGERAEIDC